MFRKTLIILAMLFAILGPGAEAWGQAGNKYVKVTSAPTDWSGEYLLVYETATDGVAWTGVDAASCNVAVTISSGEIAEKPNDAVTITIATMTGGYSIKVNGGTNNGKYIKGTSGSNALGFDNNAQLNTISYDATNKGVLITSNTSVMRYNNASNNYRFRYFKSSSYSSQKIVQLYKKEAGTPSKILTSIAISGTPNKTTYEAGESFDPAGLVVTGTYDDESQETITSGITWNVTPNPLTAGTTSVSVTATVSEITSAAYQVDGLTVNQHVVTPGTYEIIPNNTFFGIEVQTTGSHDPVTGTQNDITITHSGGTSFYCNASQVRTYKNNTLTFSVPTGYEITSIVLAVTDNASYSANVGTYTANTKTWTGSAQEIVLTSGQSSGNYQITKITVTFVAKKTLQSIAVKTPPTKTTYNVGENFDPAGLVITATYDTGDPEDIAYAGNEDKFSFSPALDAALATTDENVTITYGGKETTQAITVSKIKLATPADLAATNIASTSATLTWGEVANASKYEVKLNGIDAKTVTTNSLLVEELNASTTYTWTVKAIGDETTYEDSDESAASEFTTSALPTVAYTVTFNGNEHGTPASGSITENPAGSGVTLPNCTPNAGYQFVGWATLEIATEAEYGAGAIYYPTEDITLYAVYNEVYTINYMVNGTNTGAQENVVKGTALVFPEVSAPDADHVFCGWVTEAIEGTTDTEPAYVNTTGLTATQNNTYYAVFAERSGSEPAEQKTQTLKYDTWTYYGSTTDKDTYRLFHSGSYIESAEFDLSKLSKVIVYGGSFGGSSNNSLTIGDGTNTWKSVTVSGSSQTGTNTYTDGTPLSGTGKLRVTSNSGTASGTGVRISKVEIFTMEGGYTYSNYCTTIVEKVLTGISLSGEYPTEFWKGDTFSHDGMTVTAHYSNAPDADVTDKAEFTGYDMAAAGEQTVTVTYETASTTYSITVKTIANTPETAYTVAEAKALIDANPAELATIKVYVKGTISQVDSYNSTYHSITYWISEDGTTTNQFEVYSGKNLNNTDFASKDDVKVGDDVVVYGIIKKFNSTYEFDKNNYIVSHVKASTLEIKDITVSLGEEISPEITTNVPEAERTITYSVASEDVVKVQDGKLVTVAVGGPVTVTATLTAEGYKDATTTFTVEVIKSLTSISVKIAPTTISYKAGDKFDPTGLVITANYNDESTEDVAYAGNEDKFTFTPSLETPLTKENTSVTITYAGKEATQTITVRELYTYDITWMANGEEHTTTQVTEGDAVVLPENPSAVGDMAFQGWINTESYYNAETAPEYIVPSGIIPTGAMTFYAVYAKATEESGIKEFLFSITKDDFTTTSYADNNGSHDFTATCTTDDTKQMTVACTTNQVYQNSSLMQWQKSSGYIYNTTDLGTIKSVVVNSTEGTFTTYYGTSEHPTSGTTVGNGFFTVQVGNATGKTLSVEVTFEKETQVIIYSNYCTITPKVISENTVWNDDVTINGYTVTIESGAVLTVNGVLINTNADNLIIKDGGQLVFNDSGKDGNSGVKATVEKNIIPYSSKGDKGWYFLAAPMTDFAVTSFTNQAGNGDYDLYRWYIKDDGTPIWYNYKAHTGEFETNFLSRRGYLAAYETTDLLKMQGTLNAGTTFDFTNELNSNGNFTLLGNPFTYDLKWSDFNNKTGIYNGFAVVDSEDGIIKYAVGDTPIKVGTGFMVYTEDDGAELSFTKGSGSGKSNDILALNLFASNGNGEDNTIMVLDDENGGFAKADNFNTNVPQIYTEKNQTKYGIRNFNTSTKEFNVSFKAAGEGSNTIRLETIGEFDYVHLYDKLLDADVDMLLEGSYTFEASEDDDTHRFIVRIDKGNTGIDENDNESENFVSVYNSEIHVSGIGEVQIIDVLGRMMHSEVISGDATISTGGFKGGVYVVRLIGNGWTKTEKIVVRR